MADGQPSGRLATQIACFTWDPGEKKHKMTAVPLSKAGEHQPLQRGQDVTGSEIRAFGFHLPTRLQERLNP